MKEVAGGESGWDDAKQGCRSICDGPGAVEREAILALRHGDAAGLPPIVALHQTWALRLAAVMVGDRALAEDVVADAFLRAFGAIRRFDPERPFSPWFRRMVVTGALKVLRSRRREAEIPLRLTGSTPSAEEVAEHAQLQASVRAAVASLPPTLRATVVLRFHEGLKEREIADCLHCPLGTVKWRLADARKRLRRLLADA